MAINWSLENFYTRTKENINYKNWYIYSTNHESPNINKNNSVPIKPYKNSNL